MLKTKDISAHNPAGTIVRIVVLYVQTTSGQGILMAGQKWTIDQAARALGVSEKTIYRRIKSGQLQATLEGTPPTEHWMIEPVAGGKEETIPDSVPDGKNQDKERGTDLIHLLEDQLREKDRQISELHILLRESQGQMKLLLPESTPEPTTRVKKRHWWIFW